MHSEYHEKPIYAYLYAQCGTEARSDRSGVLSEYYATLDPLGGRNHSRACS